jgi:tRNA (guanine37-N1)-methyltransferase
VRTLVLTIFPELFQSFLSTSLIKKAIDRGLASIDLLDIRDFSDPPHNHVDDLPYGGGAGMVMKPEPLVRAIRSGRQKLPDAEVVLLTPTGTPFTQSCAVELSNRDLILVCGRYEGIDQRVIDLEVDREISIGDFVVMGGEIPAMALIEATLRLVPEVIGNSESLSTESFDHQLLEAPQYTRPPEFEGMLVPEVLLSGDHKKIAQWRVEQSKNLTQQRRPDLIKGTK